MRPPRGFLPSARRRGPAAPPSEIPFPSEPDDPLLPGRNNEKMRSKVPAIAPDRRHLAGEPRGRRAGRPEGSGACRAGRGGPRASTFADDFGDTQFWTRVNSLDSPWCLDDLTAAVLECGRCARRDHDPEGRRARGHPLRRSAACPARGQVRADRRRCSFTRSSRRPAVWPNVEAICGASPRMQGLSLGPADLAANRRMKTTRVGGGHPGYLVRNDPPVGDDGETDINADRTTYQAGSVALHDRPHGRRLRHPRDPAVLRARSATSRTPSPARTSSATPTCSGCVGAWSLHPAHRSLWPEASVQPRPGRCRAHAKRVIEAMGDGTGAIMLDGKMEDDASVKQCKVVVELARTAGDATTRATANAVRTSEETDAPGGPPGDDGAAAAPLGALHARRQRAGAGEGQDDPGRRDHLRPRGRRRPRRQARRPRRTGMRTPCVRASTAVES